MSFRKLNIFFQNRIVNHLIYWVLFVLVGSFIFSYRQNFPFLFYLLNFMVHLPVFAAFTYFSIYWLVPAFLLKGRYFPFVLHLAVASAMAALLKLLVGRYVYFALFIPQVLHPKIWFTADAFLVNLLWVVFPTILFAMFKYYKNWIKSQDITNEAERKRLASELQVLKAQLNPHFLFNTFNNLYALALVKSDKTPAVIAKMSDMFHYMLYECNANEVPVSKEIKLIENYIELEQLRYTDRLTFQFEKNIDNYNYLIPPMLLYSLVENCFKHGSSPDPDSPWIRISLRIKGESFDFEASNSTPTNSAKKTGPYTGVGLANIRRRLELIYPGANQLTITRGSGNFVVMLKINKGGLK